MTDRLTIVTDRREQRPWIFSPAVDVIPGTLHGCDYSVAGFEDCIGCERKSLADLVGSFTSGRSRFLRSLDRLAERRWRCVIIEGSLSALIAGTYRSDCRPSSLLGSMCSVMADHRTPFLFADSPASATTLAERWLVKCADRAAAARDATESEAA